MKKIAKILMGLAVIPLTLGYLSGGAQASQVATQWFFGNWDCSIDGRPAKMRWQVVNDPQTTCNGNTCSTTSGVKVVGSFSDNGGAWVPLGQRYVNGNEFGIRYLGAEQDDWMLRYNPKKKVATGWTTWRGNKYPLQCTRRSP
jgi:hypothetical protein